MGEWFDTVITITSPRPFSEALEGLQGFDKKRIAEAIVSDDPGLTAPSGFTSLAASGSAIEGAQSILPELLIHQEMMIDVATRGTQIQDVNDYYLARQVRLTSLCPASNVPYTNPHEDLWAWFHYWKSEGYDSYRERRHYIRELFKPSIRAAAGRAFAAVHEREPTGWERVDRGLVKARADLDVASVEEAWQGVGLLCREVLISLAQEVHDSDRHPTTDETGKIISDTDAKRLLEAWLRHEYEGGSNKEIRSHIRASLDLANNLQHRRTATRQLAASALKRHRRPSRLLQYCQADGKKDNRRD